MPFIRLIKFSSVPHTCSECLSQVMSGYFSAPTETIIFFFFLVCQYGELHLVLSGKLILYSWHKPLFIHDTYFLHNDEYDLLNFFYDYFVFMFMKVTDLSFFFPVMSLSSFGIRVMLTSRMSGEVISPLPFSERVFVDMVLFIP